MNNEVLLKKIKVLLKEGQKWVFAHKITVVGFLIVVFFVGMPVRSCVVARAREKAILEEQERYAVKLRQESEQRALEAEKQKKITELFRILERTHKNEDSLENRRDLQNLKEIINVLGCDLKNKNSESLLYTAYKHNQPDVYINILKDFGATMTSDEMFEVKRVATENLRKNIYDGEKIKKYIELGADLSDIDGKSLLFLSVHSQRPMEGFKLTQSALVLKNVGLNFHPEEKKLIEDALTTKFWKNVSSSASVLEREISDLVQFGLLGFDIPKILNAPCLNKNISIGNSANCYGKSALFAARSKKLDLSLQLLSRENNTGISSPWNTFMTRDIEEQLDNLIAVLNKFGAQMSQEEEQLIVSQEKIVREKANKELLEAITTKTDISFKDIDVLLKLGANANAEGDDGKSLLYHAMFWRFLLPDEIRVNIEQVTVGARVSSLRTVDKESTKWFFPLENEKIELLKKHGAVFKEGEEEYLKKKAQEWIIKYFSFDSLIEKFDLAKDYLSGKEINFNISLSDPAIKKKVLEDVTFGYQRKLFDPVFAERALSDLLNICGCLPPELSYVSGKKSLFRTAQKETQKSINEIDSSLVSDFSKNAKRKRHSLLYIAWDKGYPQSVQDVLKSHGIQFINEEERVVAGIRRVYATRNLLKFFENPKGGSSALKVLLKEDPYLNAKWHGHSVLWHAKNNKLDEDFVNLLEKAGAKIAGDEQ